ncbi:MAG: hypothetical protein WC319_04415 [Candidatus Paceibacterota bacterium]|jgi:hypothetical protein
MDRIALYYADSPLSSLEFDDEAESQELFETVKITDPIITTTRVQGTLLNGRVYDHKLYSREFVEVTISADEIDGSILSFLQSFWAAEVRYIAYKSTIWGDYIQVYTDSGDFPINYIEDLLILREVTFKLYYVDVVLEEGGS